MGLYSKLTEKLVIFLRNTDVKITVMLSMCSKFLMKCARCGILNLISIYIQAIWPDAAAHPGLNPHRPSRRERHQRGTKRLIWEIN